MDPVEINAGAWYLRALRDDNRVSDIPELSAGGITDPAYVATAARNWADETRLTWAVCEPTTGKLLAEIAVEPEKKLLTGWALPGNFDALEQSVKVVARFSASVLNVTPIIDIQSYDTNRFSGSQ